MSKKVFIGVGHGGTDSGAVKYIVCLLYTSTEQKLLVFDVTPNTRWL